MIQRILSLQRSTCRAILPVATAALALLMQPVAAGSPAVKMPDPTDADAPVPPLEYRSVLTEPAGGRLRAVDSPRLSWPRLFTPTGEFATEPQAAAPAAAGDPPATGTTAAVGGGDARAVVKAVYPDRGRVKLDHGPIERLGMPGMTMVFRVRDAALLDGLAPGDAVDVDIEVDGGTFYVTDIRKEGGQ